MTCAEVSPGVHICHTPMKEVTARALGERWCFVCRKRRPFMLLVSEPIGLSYYGPTKEVRCCTCDTVDGDCFPGTEREWDE